MSKTVTLEIADEVYAALQEMASNTGRAFEDLVLEWRVKYRPKVRAIPSEEDRQTAWGKLQRHLGAQDLGRATGADNASIDADLARDYGGSHERP